ncbi:shikimate dehydrogenase [uncultured Castellaniella sp.]|uniref:shikimate dehydrogenase family protein n=1 Tax=uncultured Castellaniella sp. TaxID=647907 RepID=UPI0026186ED9|nr:shikimate dehydrogenase [uncultured Castellaniella sp.]
MLNLSGKTRLYYIVGDPIAQVKSPAGMTTGFAERGLDAVVVPAHVSRESLADFFAGAKATRNVDGIIATVPHKFGAAEQCDELSERARFLGSANVARRMSDGKWFGDQVDGLGFVQALRDTGFDLRGKRALLVGAGGAGSAIAQALLDAGVASLGICDLDARRLDHLVGRLASLNLGAVSAASSDPAGLDLVVNATPMGMRASDPSPVRVESLTAGMAVGDVITAPAVSPLIKAARTAGCRTVTGLEMFACVARYMLDFYTD